MLRGTHSCSDIFKILGLIASVPGDLSVFSWRRHFLTSSSVISNVVSVSVVRFFGVPCGMLANVFFCEYSEEGLIDDLCCFPVALANHHACTAVTAIFKIYNEQIIDDLMHVMH